MRVHKCIITEISHLPTKRCELVAIHCLPRSDAYNEQLKDAKSLARKFGLEEAEMGVWRSEHIELRCEVKEKDLDEKVPTYDHKFWDPLKIRRR